MLHQHATTMVRCSEVRRAVVHSSPSSLQAFEAKEEIAHSIKSSLQQVMQEYGFAILNALVTDLEPDGKVRAAMNEINASRRLKEAVKERAEGDKILMVSQPWHGCCGCPGIP
jgi:regulator of protease activity HflC (stomatin/prohibitin superfamily)